MAHHSLHSGALYIPKLCRPAYSKDAGAPPAPCLPKLVRRLPCQDAGQLPAGDQQGPQQRHVRAGGQLVHQAGGPLGLDSVSVQ